MDGQPGMGDERGNDAQSLTDPQSLYADAEPVTQHRIVQAHFEPVEVLRPNELWLHPSVEVKARETGAAAMTGEFRVEVRRTGRGERDSPDTTSPLLMIPVTNVPSHVHGASRTA